MRELLELLEHDARRSIKDLATMLGRSEYEVEEQMKKLEKDKIILGYNAMIDWNKYGDNNVNAIIEVNVTPQPPEFFTGRLKKNNSHAFGKPYVPPLLVPQDYRIKLPGHAHLPVHGLDQIEVRLYLFPVCAAYRLADSAAPGYR